MTTITAVQLRKNLDKIIKRASKGEQIRVTYRGTTVVTIGPDSTQSAAVAGPDIETVMRPFWEKHHASRAVSVEEMNQDLRKIAAERSMREA